MFVCNTIHHKTRQYITKPCNTSNNHAIHHKTMPFIYPSINPPSINPPSIFYSFIHLLFISPFSIRSSIFYPCIHLFSIHLRFIHLPSIFYPSIHPFPTTSMICESLREMKMRRADLLAPSGLISLRRNSKSTFIYFIIQI